jgi:hypothetical protein
MLLLISLPGQYSGRRHLEFRKIDAIPRPNDLTSPHFMAMLRDRYWTTSYIVKHVTTKIKMVAAAILDIEKSMPFPYHLTNLYQT